MGEADQEQSPESPVDGAEGASAEPEQHEPVEAAESQTLALAPITGPIEAMPARKKPRGRALLLAMSILVLVVSIAASLYIGTGNVTGLPLAFTGPTATTRVRDLPVTPTMTLPAALPSATATATTAVPPPVVNAGDGAPPPSGDNLPPYTGPISGGQGCPNGQAPRPVGYAIHSASDYGAPRANVVALTFDDGPTPSYTPAILSYLEKTHTPATFFVLGQYVKAYPWLIQREAADGFTIGIHTWNHPDMKTLTSAQRAWQLATTAQQLHTVLGANACLWLWRPPYGSYNSAIVAQAGTFGLTTVVWNDDPADWSQPGTMTIVNRVLSTVRPGSIILMHDGPAGRAQTLAALPYILDGLHKRGLTPVSLPQLLFGYQPPAPTPTPTPSPPGDPTPTVAPTPTDVPSSASSLP